MTEDVKPSRERKFVPHRQPDEVRHPNRRKRAKLNPNDKRDKSWKKEIGDE